MTTAFIYRATSAHFALLLLFLLGNSVESREWQSIVNHDIVVKSNVDSRRYELAIESDPLLFPGDKSHTEIPTEPPQAQQKVWTTFSPTKSPSKPAVIATSGPTTKPTEFNVELNGGCGAGKRPLKVHMKDTWGDGWEGTYITISAISDLDPLAANLPTKSMTTTNANAQGDTVVSISKTIDFDTTGSKAPEQTDPLGKVFEGTLENGYHDFQSICIVPNRCYRLVANGGEFLDEVSWELRPGNLDSGVPPMEPILSGSAPAGCTFSLPDENGHHFCENTCSESILADSTAAPPQVTEQLQSNQQDVAVEPLTESTQQPEGISGSLDGTTAQVTPVTQSMISNTESNAITSEVLKDFTTVSANEDSEVAKPLTEAIEQPQALSNSFGGTISHVTPVTESMISNEESNVNTSDVLKDFTSLSANEDSAAATPLMETVEQPQALQGSFGGMKAQVTPVTQSMVSNTGTENSAIASNVLKNFKFAGGNGENNI
eukprot:jgi/Psemu1/282090/fgenesh1_pg.2_\